MIILNWLSWYFKKLSTTTFGILRHFSSLHVGHIETKYLIRYINIFNFVSAILNDVLPYHHFFPKKRLISVFMSVISSSNVTFFYFLNFKCDFSFSHCGSSLSTFLRFLIDCLTPAHWTSPSPILSSFLSSLLYEIIIFLMIMHLHILSAVSSLCIFIILYIFLRMEIWISVSIFKYPI